MESIGERLRSAREARKLAVRDVVKQTNISPSYIEALEEEDFERFPSETYLIGFLRSYADFLKLDPDEMVSSYRGHKIGESATPLEELTRPTTPDIAELIKSFMAKPVSRIIAAGAVLVLVIVVLIVAISGSTSLDNQGKSIDSLKKEYSDNKTNPDYGSISQLQLVGDRGMVLVSRNEAVQFMVEGREAVFILEKISTGENESASIKVMPEKKIVLLTMNNPVTVTIPGVAREIIFTLKGTTDNRAKLLVSTGARRELAEKEITPADGGDSTRATTLTGKTLKIVFEVRFNQKSFIEVYLDGNMRARGFIPEGTVERWEAMENIQVKMGNAGGLDIRINNKQYNFGGPGQVANKVIRWKRDIADPNVYHIEVKDW